MIDIVEARQWQPIETAPMDGTVISVKNSQMDREVDAKYGEYTSSWGTKSKQFVLVRDYDRFMPLPPGTLVIPTHWRALTPAERPGSGKIEGDQS